MKNYNDFKKALQNDKIEEAVCIYFNNGQGDKNFHLILTEFPDKIEKFNEIKDEVYNSFED